MDEETILDFNATNKTIVLGRADFIRMAMPTEEGKVDLKNFGCWLRIDLDGLYVNIDHEEEADLTPEEAASLCPHPTGDLGAPVLRFPFTVGDLERFLAFSSEEGLDVPLSGKKFEQVIASKKRQDPVENIEFEPNKPSPHESKSLTRPEQRLEPLRRWFKGQQEFTEENLRSARSGKPGARDACWCWLGQQGMNEPGHLFDGALQANSNKTKKFDDAWSDFLRESADR